MCACSPYLSILQCCLLLVFVKDSYNCGLTMKISYNYNFGFQTHLGGEGPVHATISDNLVAYHYWSRTSERWELGVLEIVEDIKDGIGFPDIIKAGFGEKHVSAYDTVDVKVGKTADFIGVKFN